LARATQRYNFSNIAAPVALTLTDCRSFFDSLSVPNGNGKSNRIVQLHAAMSARIQQINARTPAIDGKSTNPFVLAAYSDLFGVHTLKQVDDIVAAAKVFSSIETAAGRVVEDVIPPFFGWTQVNSPGHTVLSEIDSARVVGDTVELVALKSGPMCINDSMVSQISNAVAANWAAWGEHWQVNKVRYIVGMNYSTAKNSNKKDWHIVRLAEERSKERGSTITDSCIQAGGRLPVASSFFEAQLGDKSLRVETMQGRSLWAHVAGSDDAFLQICWAMVKCLNPTAVAPTVNFATGEMREIIDFSARVNAQGISDAEKQWLVLLARHFVDELRNT